jgi:hypothetical protein
VLSTDAVQDTEIRVGYTDVVVSVGAGLGAVVSGGVVSVTLMLGADRWPLTSMAMTVQMVVRPGSRFDIVNVVCGGSTLKQPAPSVWTQYHQFVEPPFAGSHASEMLVSELAVIRRFVGAVGGVVSPGGGGGLFAGAAETKTRANARTLAANAVLRSDIWLLPWALTLPQEIRPSLTAGFRLSASVLADVRDLRVRGADEVCGLQPQRLLVRAGLEDDRVAVGDATVDEDGIVARAAQRRDRAQVEVGVVAAQIVLGREMHLLLPGAEQIAELVRVDAAVGPDDGARVAVRSGDDERLRDIGVREPERFSLGSRALGVRVRQEFVLNAGSVERSGEVFSRHGAIIRGQVFHVPRFMEDLTLTRE